MRSMRLLVALGLLASVVGCRTQATKPAVAPKAPKQLKIGALLPLTGDAAVWGKNAKEGIDLAIAKVNSAAGPKGTKLSVVYEDSQADPKTGVSAFNKLISVQKVPAVIGDIVSSVVLAVAPIATQKQVVILSPGATAPNISGISKFVFRNWNSDALEGKVAADFCRNQLKLSRAAIIYINNDYGKGLQEVFAREFAARAGQVVAAETFPQNATSYRTQISKAKAAKPEVLYLAGYPKEIPLVLKQARELGLKCQVLATVAFEDPQVVKVARAAAEGVVYPFPAPLNDKDPARQDYMTAFKTKYHKAPGIGVDTCWDAVNMIAEAIRLGGGASGDQIRGGLTKLKHFPGASGVMTFDAYGDVNKPMVMKTVRGGKFVPLQR